MEKPATSAYLTHAQFLEDPVALSGVKDLNFGDVIEFSYNLQSRLVFVLNPNWSDKLHGLDMYRVSHLDLKDTVLPPMFKIDDPEKFYQNGKNIKDLVKDTDSYRTFLISKMSNIRRMTYHMT